MAIPTGIYSAWNHVQDLATTGLGPGIPTTAAYLRKNGHSTAAFVSKLVLNSMCGLNRGFDVYHDSISSEPGEEMHVARLERRASETIDHCLQWLQGQRRPRSYLWGFPMLNPSDFRRWSLVLAQPTRTVSRTYTHGGLARVVG